MNVLAYLVAMREIDRKFLDGRIERAIYEQKRKALTSKWLREKKEGKGKAKKKNNPCRIHCGVCKAISPKGYNFNKRMTWLRSHRKKKHNR